MQSRKRLLPLAGLLFFLGLSGLFRFSHGVRSVDAVGLSGSGFSLGVGFALVVLGLGGRFDPGRASGRQ